MTNKIITLEGKNRNGDYLLYSGEERKRKFGFFGYSDKMHFVRRKQSIPYVELFLRTGEEIRNVFKYNVENEDYSLFGRSFQNKGDKNQIVIEGKNLVDTYRIFEIMNSAKKIPCIPSYVGGSLAGDIIPRGINVESEIYWKTFNELKEKIPLKDAIEWKFNFLGDSYAINYLKFINKKTRVSKKKIKQIEKLFPLDDNGEEIKESD